MNMAHRMALLSIRRADRILKNGPFIEKFNIFSQIQPKCLQSRKFLDGPSFDQSKGFVKPIQPKESSMSSACDAAVNDALHSTSNSSSGGGDGPGGDKTKSSSGPGLVREGGSITFTNITAEDFVEDYFLEPNIKTSTVHIERVELLPGASENAGKVLWFKIEDTGPEDGVDGKKKMLILRTISIAGILGVCWVYLTYEKFSWKGFVDGFLGRGTSGDARMGVNGESEHWFSSIADITILTTIPAIYMLSPGVGVTPRELCIVACIAIGICFAIFNALYRMVVRMLRGLEGART